MKTANFGGKSVQIVTGYQHLPELSEKLKPFSYRVLKEDCLDLPPKTFVKRLVTLTPDQKKLYLQMKQFSSCTNGWQDDDYSYSYDSVNEITTNYLWSLYC